MSFDPSRVIDSKTFAAALLECKATKKPGPCKKNLTPNAKMKRRKPQPPGWFAKAKAIAAASPGKVAAVVANHEHVAPVIEAYKKTDSGRFVAVGKEITKQAAKKLGKNSVEALTGFSKDLWNEVSSKYGKKTAFIASAAYVALNRASLFVESASGVRFIPLLGKGIATARQYALYYGVSAATSILAKPKVLEWFEDEQGFDIESVVAAMRQYDSQLSDKAGVKPGRWTDDEIRQAAVGVLGS